MDSNEGKFALPSIHVIYQAHIQLSHLHATLEGERAQNRNRTQKPVGTDSTYVRIRVFFKSGEEKKYE